MIKLQQFQLIEQRYPGAGLRRRPNVVSVIATSHEIGRVTEKRVIWTFFVDVRFYFFNNSYTFSCICCFWFKRKSQQMSKLCYLKIALSITHPTSVWRQCVVTNVTLWVILFRFLRTSRPFPRCSSLRTTRIYSHDSL